MNRPAAERFRPWLPIAALTVVLLVTLALGREAPDNSVAARADRIASGIKCAVCQGLSVAQSKTSSAQAIYDEIVRQVEAGRSDDDIRGYVAGRYGDELLLRPSSSGTGAVVWILPVALGVAALAFLGFTFRRWRPQPIADLSDTDRAIVARARRQAAQHSENDADPDAELAQPLPDPQPEPIAAEQP